MALSRRLRKLLEAATATPEGAVAVEDMLANFVDDAEAAEKFYKSFHWGNDASDLTAQRAPIVREGDVLVELGELAEIAYETTKGEQHAIWVHEFGPRRPTLAWTRAGKLVIVGGGYRVTRAGIVG